MAYTKTTWVNGQEPAISADNLNKIENGIYNTNLSMGTLEEYFTDPTGAETVDQVLSLLGAATLKSGSSIKDALGNLITLPSAQLDSKVHIATGSYTGTGTYGATNKNSLTAPFDIKLAIIMSASGNVLILMNGVTQTYPNIAGSNYWVGSEHVESVAWGTNTVSWYNTFSDVYQLNFGANKYILVG